MDAGLTNSGVYNITLKEEPIEVYCDMETPDHGYVVISLLMHFAQVVLEWSTAP